MPCESPTVFPDDEDDMALWRVAILAYRKARHEGKMNMPAVNAAVAALKEAKPDITEQEAKDIASELWETFRKAIPACSVEFTGIS